MAICTGKGKARTCSCILGAREPVCWEPSWRPGKDSVSAGRGETSALGIGLTGRGHACSSFAGVLRKGSARESSGSARRRYCAESSTGPVVGFRPGLLPRRRRPAELCGFSLRQHGRPNTDSYAAPRPSPSDPLPSPLVRAGTIASHDGPLASACRDHRIFFPPQTRDMAPGGPPHGIIVETVRRSHSRSYSFSRSSKAKPRLRINTTPPIEKPSNVVPYPGADFPKA